jgi:predicted DNA binding protein
VSVIARISVPAEAFALGEVLEIREGIRVRLESMIPTGESTVPFFWVPSDDADGVESALRGSSLVDEVNVIDEVDGETLFRVEWSAEVDGLIDAIEATDGVILEGTGKGDDWSFELRFPNHAGLSGFYRACVDEGIGLELEQVHEPLGRGSGRGFGLTDGQQEALALALAEGYFDVPRRTTLVELAADLGVSDTAASQRIRRGLTSLLSATLGTEPQEEEEESEAGED